MPSIQLSMLHSYHCQYFEKSLPAKSFRILLGLLVGDPSDQRGLDERLAGQFSPEHHSRERTSNLGFSDPLGNQETRHSLLLALMMISRLWATLLAG